MNITRIPQMSVAVDGWEYHTLVFNLCRNLSNSTCPSIHSRAPGNGCDCYNKTGILSCYWIGGFSNWNKTKYSDVLKEWRMSYTGIVNLEGWIFGLEAIMKCDEIMENNTVECFTPRSHQTTTTYTIELRSKYACPIDPTPPQPQKKEKGQTKLSTGDIVGIVFGGIGGMVLIIIIIGSFAFLGFSSGKKKDYIGIPEY